MILSLSYVPRVVVPPTSYYDTSGWDRRDVLSGGSRMVPITTPIGEFRMWTKRVGTNPDVHLDVGLIHEPAVSCAVAALSRRLDDQWGEALHPPVDGDVVDVDATLGEEFFDIAVRESVAEVPADGQEDHVRWEPEACERDRIRTAAANQSGTLRLPPDPPTQRCRLNDRWTR